MASGGDRLTLYDSNQGSTILYLPTQYQKFNESLQIGSSNWLEFGNIVL